MKILALTKYTQAGPSSRYRYYNYQKAFEQYGIEMDIAPLFPTAFLQTSDKKKKLLLALFAYGRRKLLLLGLLFFKRYELLVIEYELFPYMPALFERLLVLRGYRYIVDYDDAIFHKYDMRTNPLISLFLHNKIATVISKATTTIVCNDYLASYAKRFTTSIFRIPTVVLLDNYIQKTELHKTNKRPESGFVIGWIGSKSTSFYILEILPILERFVASYEDVSIHLVGFDGGLLSQETIQRCHIKVIPWSEEGEIDAILDFTVGIMPLHNDPWSRGKCGFKLIQYMSCHKPLIASPVGINCDLVNEPHGGYLASTLEEWYEALEKIYLNKEERDIMGEENFKQILEHYNHTKETQKYAQLIMDITSFRK